jgi:Winged helix domain, variant/ATPase family associated with various cellular activities (AAA)
VKDCEPPQSCGLPDSLSRLDKRLREMVEHMRAQTGREPGADPLRGLYISEADAIDLLSGPRPTAAEDVMCPAMAHGPAFDELRGRCGLSSLECDVLLIALAPEVDLRYERIYAYLQDDVSRRRPSIDLTLTILCASPADKVRNRKVFHGSAGLRRNSLIRLLGEESTPIARREIALERRVLALLAGDSDYDSNGIPFVRRIEPTHIDIAADPGAERLASAAKANGFPFRACFRGSSDEAKRATAISCAAKLGAPLLAADLARACRAPSFSDWLEDLLREATLGGAIVYLEGFDSITDEGLREFVQRTLREFSGALIFSTEDQGRLGRLRMRGLVPIPFEMPSWQERRSKWRDALRERGFFAQGRMLDSLAECFPFHRREIEDVAETAARLADYRGEPLQPEHVFEAARMSCGHELAALTRKISPAYGWDDLVLPDEQMASLRELCRRVQLRQQVLGNWAFNAKLSGGKGVNALFHGHSGTGKTMAAEVVARELHLDLYKIDLAGLVSKYIGETEKNLDRIFAAATNANAILFFDEADALFGKRSEVRDSHDRYANLEISYLLQKMEQYEGVSILATNLKQNLDDAFLRRLAFSIAFPFPDEDNRRRIWEQIWPKSTPLDTDVDAGWLASRFLLSGGNIRNVALAAAFLAADSSGLVTLAHVLRAVRSEFQKMGKTLSAAELLPPLSAIEGAA